MRRIMGALVVSCLVTSVAFGHALYIVPEGGETVVVVFGHGLQPDPKVKESSWQRMSGLKLTARGANRPASPVTWTKAEHSLSAKVPAGTQIVAGSVDYGVYAKEGKSPRYIQFLPKAVIGAIPTDGGILGQACSLELVPIMESGKVRFRVLSHGKPVANAAVEVLVPEKNEHVDVNTDDTGLTPAFDARGRYAATVRHEEAKSGEVGGQKYESIVRVATLVVDVK